MKYKSEGMSGREKQRKRKIQKRQMENGGKKETEKDRKIKKKK